MAPPNAGWFYEKGIVHARIEPNAADNPHKQTVPDMILVVTI